ncbi:hypothetical protein BUALT_Bualt10G0130600 [Buddleja alternifolia]|uniref:Protein kinase domain-containing protein n=1 Tax=Buddleja alternifolia TaxID=168488 RepID=A0AAV6X9B8_9LAMI|nr:hypothetical protein BUALT_Bualt10G0130600 [Buddleja alternifolia]
MHIMDSNGTTPDKKIISCSPSQQRTLHNTSTSKQRRKAEAATTTTTTTRGFCRRFSDCMVMGPAVSQREDLEKRATKLDQLVQQVEEIDKELKKQKEMKGMYKTKLDKTQVFLKYCLQVAQDNGFLDLILSKDKGQDFSLSPTITQSSFSLESPSPAQYHPDIAALVHQAKINGWYIDPQEVKFVILSASSFLIEIQHLSAQGTTADIYRGKWRGLDVAIKCMYPDFFRSNENGVSFFAQEVETLSKQRHPFVLQLIGASLDPPENCWIVTEFLNTDLKDWLHGPGKRQKERTIAIPPLKDRISKALEIAQAMQYLHENKPKILHRDLKPSNIFLDDAFHVRVADFGHARYLIDGEKALTGETGTFVYMAPEVIQCSPYDEKCDVYSFGVILNELITGEYPYIDTEYGPAKIAMEVAMNGLRPSMAKVDEQMDGVNELIKQSWDQEAAVRPTFAEITSTLRIIDKKLKDGS